MRGPTIFLLILIGCITLAYTQDKWLPPLVDFIIQKSTPTKSLSEDADYQLYKKYQNFKYSEPDEQCHVQCASGNFSAFKFCEVTNKCSSIK